MDKYDVATNAFYIATIHKRGNLCPNMPKWIPINIDVKRLDIKLEPIYNLTVEGERGKFAFGTMYLEQFNFALNKLETTKTDIVLSSIPPIEQVEEYIKKGCVYRCGYIWANRQQCELILVDDSRGKVWDETKHHQIYDALWKAERKVSIYIKKIIDNDGKYYK